MKRSTFLKTLIATTLAAFTLTACDNSGSTQAKDSVAQIKEKGVIRIGVFSDKPPFGYIDANGKNQGFDVEIAKEIANDLLGSPDKVEFVLTEAANRVEYLKSNKVDLVLANFTKTPERAEVVDFAEPYMNVALGVVSPKMPQLQMLNNLKAKPY